MLPLGGVLELGRGADVDEVARVVGADRRIGPKFLKAGPGFGGSCFKKDVLNLVYLCESFGLHTAAEYWMGVVKMNEHQQERIVARLFKEMFNTLYCDMEVRAWRCGNRVGAARMEHFF